MSWGMWEFFFIDLVSFHKIKLLQNTKKVIGYSKDFKADKQNENLQ